mgnify:CR=1 FL=1
MNAGFNITTADKWTEFDKLATEAREARERYIAFSDDCCAKYGTNPFSTPGQLSGGAWPCWSDDDKAHIRGLLNDAYYAEDRAMAAKPPHVHNRTARNRLRAFVEGLSP